MFGETASPITSERAAELRRRLARHKEPGRRCRCRRCSSDRSELICSGEDAYSTREVTPMDLSVYPAAEDVDTDAATAAEEEADDAIGDDPA